MSEKTVRKNIEIKYDSFFGSGYWESQYKKHIVEFGIQCVRDIPDKEKEEAEDSVIKLTMMNQSLQNEKEELIKYVNHWDHCKIRASNKCTCGLEELLFKHQKK